MSLGTSINVFGLSVLLGSVKSNGVKFPSGDLVTRKNLAPILYF